jgi:hypothetical protein
MPNHKKLRSQRASLQSSPSLACMNGACSRRVGNSLETHSDVRNVGRTLLLPEAYIYVYRHMSGPKPVRQDFLQANKSTTRHSIPQHMTICPPQRQTARRARGQVPDPSISRLKAACSNFFPSRASSFYAFAFLPDKYQTMDMQLARFAAPKNWLPLTCRLAHNDTRSYYAAAYRQFWSCINFTIDSTFRSDIMEEVEAIVAHMKAIIIKVKGVAAPWERAYPNSCFPPRIGPWKIRRLLGKKQRFASA